MTKFHPVVREEFTTVLPEDVRQTWCVWLRHHTIDPDDVAVPGFVEVDNDKRRISYMTYERDAAGAIRLNSGGESALQGVRVIQLEAQPSPPPGGRS